MTERVADREDTMTELRDHRYPCEHPSTEALVVSETVASVPVWKCSKYGCPGGRIVAINLEAAGLSEPNG